jgi:hypothetical protein
MRLDRSGLKWGVCLDNRPILGGVIRRGLSAARPRRTEWPRDFYSPN